MSAYLERLCAKCGFHHDKGSTFDHPWEKPQVDAFEIIAPGQRIPYMKGAAVAFGLVGMAEAIAEKHWLEACPSCGKASGSRTYEMPSAGSPWARKWVCISCYRDRAALSPGMDALRRLFHFGTPTPRGGYR